MTADSTASKSTTDRPRGGLVALCVAETTSWGILYYSLLVSAEAIVADTGWDAAAVTGAFSAGLIVSAVVGILVGRLLDSRGPRQLMTAGSVIGVSGLVIVALAPNLLVFTLGWLLAGVAQAAGFYQPAFAVITRWYGPRRERSLTVLTLVAGFASTVFAPVTVALLAAFDWRGTFLVLAGILGLVTVPLHWFFLNSTWRSAPEPAERSKTRRPVLAVVGTRKFWALEGAMVLSTAGLYSVSLSLIPLLMEKGIGYEMAAIALGLLGAGQVLGRIFFIAIPKGSKPWMRVVLIVGIGAASAALLALVPGPAALVIAIAVLAGAAKGCHTLINATAVADRWGTTNFASINGMFAAPLTVTAAVAPALGPIVAGFAGSYGAMALIMAAIAAAGVLAARAS